MERRHKACRPRRTRPSEPVRLVMQAPKGWQVWANFMVLPMQNLGGGSELGVWSGCAIELLFRVDLTNLRRAHVAI